MYGYEELASYTSGDIRSHDCLLGLFFYKAKDTDKIIHAYEARINELENIIKVDNAIRITKLEAENALLKAMKWISVDDVKPQWGKKVKVKFKDGSEDEVRFSHDYKWVSKGMATCESSEVTHWMPSPTTKESETKENG